jgi:hypothetical protein
MKATKIYFERKFVLGANGPKAPADSFVCGMEYSLEGDETPESVEEPVMEKIYAAADRERKRRWQALRRWQKEQSEFKAAETKAKNPAVGQI